MHLATCIQNIAFAIIAGLYCLQDIRRWSGNSASFCRWFERVGISTRTFVLWYIWFFCFFLLYYLCVCAFFKYVFSWFFACHSLLFSDAFPLHFSISCTFRILPKLYLDSATTGLFSLFPLLPRLDLFFSIRDLHLYLCSQRLVFLITISLSWRSTHPPLSPNQGHILALEHFKLDFIHSILANKQNSWTAWTFSFGYIQRFF